LTPFFLLLSGLIVKGRFFAVDRWMVDRILKVNL